MNSKSKRFGNERAISASRWGKSAARFTAATAFAAFFAFSAAQSVNTYLGTDGPDADAVVSENGQVVAFVTSAQLDASDTNGVADVYVWVRSSGDYELVSVRNAGGLASLPSRNPVVSETGRYIAFETLAPLAPSDDNGTWDIYVRDRVGGTTSIISRSAAGEVGNGPSINAAIDRAGDFVAFESTATNLVPNDTNGFSDVFLSQASTPVNIERVSIADDESEANGPSFRPSGFQLATSVAFDSQASNLVDSDTSTNSDVFVRDLAGTATVHASINPDGTGLQGNSFSPAYSASGTVAFLSTTSQAGGNGKNQVFLHTLATDELELVSVAEGTDVAGNGEASAVSIDADGEVVGFTSDATNLIASDTNGVSDTFARNTDTDTTIRTSVDVDSSQLTAPSFGGNLTLVAGQVQAPFQNGNRLLAYNELVAASEQIATGAVSFISNGDAYRPALSRNGRYVAFESSADNLVSNDTNGVPDVFVLDLATGFIERVSVNTGGLEANGYSYQADISADGRYVAFVSVASNLVSGDNNGVSDVFVRDRQTGETVAASLNAADETANGASSEPSISDDGRRVAFSTVATDITTLLDGNSSRDVYVRNFDTNSTIRASLRTDGSARIGDSYGPAMSGDGRFVAFTSNAVLADEDLDTVSDIYVHTIGFGITELVSTDSSGDKGNGPSAGAFLNNDGSVVAFESLASNLVADDTNGVYDVFVKSLIDSETQRLSVRTDGQEGDADSWNVELNADGTIAVFTSLATNLVRVGPGDVVSGNWSEAYIHDLERGVTGRISKSSDGTVAEFHSGLPALDGTGRTYAFQSAGQPDALTVGDANDRFDVFYGWMRNLAALSGTAEVTGGLPASLDLELTEPAPADGYTVDVASSDDAVFEVIAPTTKVLSSGQQTATVELDTDPVTEPVSAILSATMLGETIQRTVTVVPPELVSVTVAPSLLTGGDPATGTVTLSGPAPAGGWTVALTDDNADVTIPASVQVPQGSASANFSVTTVPVTTDQTVTITATDPRDNTIQDTAVLTVRAPRLLSFDVSPTVVTGGTGSQGTITLTGEAPAGGWTINLSSSDAAATVPSDVTVPAGDTSANFAITTTPVAADVVVTITADAPLGLDLDDQLTVFAPRISTVQTLPATVIGGSNPLLRVDLTGPAPAGGWEITVNSDNPSVADLTAPASFTVPAGDTFAEPELTTAAVAVDTPVEFLLVTPLGGGTVFNFDVLAPPPGFEVQAQVVLSDYVPPLSTKPVSVQVLERGSQNVLESHEVQTDDEGRFKLQTNRTGRYDVRVDAETWLPKRLQAVEFRAEGVYGLVTTLLNGDINQDNRVGVQDYLALVAAYGSAEGDAEYTLAVDLNKDGKIGSADFLILVSNYGKVGDE
jgi:hypothetical protein